MIIFLLDEFEKYANDLGVEKIAYTKMDAEYTTDEMYENVIVGIMPMDDELLGVTPDRSLKEKYKQLYVTITDVMEKLCVYIETLGYNTYMIDQLDMSMNFSIIAQKAILGHIGNNKLLITSGIGPGHKIILITTDMPIEDKMLPDIEKKVITTCSKCYQCIRSCPENALYVSGGEIYFDKKKCIGYTHGCTYCITVCPFQKEKEKVVI